MANVLFYAVWSGAMSTGLRALVRLGAVAAGLLLGGCGAGISWSNGNPVATAGSYSAPLTGRYSGRLSGNEANGTFWLRMLTSGTANGRAIIANKTIDLTGRMTSNSRLVLTGGGLTIDGTFHGAFHPQDSGYYEPRGVGYRGTWESTSVQLGSGTVVGWHDAWPPTLYNHNTDPWYGDYFWYGGGSSNTGGGITLPPISSGGTGTLPPSTGGTGSTGGSGGTGGSTGPVNGSGDGSGTGVIWREQR